MEDSGIYLQSDLEILMFELKERCAKLQLEKDQSAILSLLTLAPVSWTIGIFGNLYNYQTFKLPTIPTLIA